MTRSDMVIRGTRAGARPRSYLPDPGADELAARVQVWFVCPDRHEWTVPFSADAPVPATWDCPRCGQVGAGSPEQAAVLTEQREEQAAGSRKTHRDQVLERRSPQFREAMLTEALDRLHRRQAVAR